MLNNKKHLLVSFICFIQLVENNYGHKKDNLLEKNYLFICERKK